MIGSRPGRGGLVGGIFLVILGVLFLVHGFRPEFNAAQLLFHWWPLLLIFWGVARLIENMSARRTGQTPGPVITGGEIFLIFLVVAACGAILAVEKYGPDIQMGNNDEMPFGQHAEVTEELPAKALKPGAEILIQAQRGDITITGTDALELRVVAKKTGFAMDENTAQSRAHAATIRLVETSHGFEVRPEISSSGGEQTRTNLDIQVPKQSVITVKTENGDVHVCDITGNVFASTARGTLEVCNAGADVHAEVKHGDVRILTVKGNVRLTGSGSEVEISDVTGDASVEGEFYGPIRARNVVKGVNFVSTHTNLAIGALPGKMEMDSGDLSMDDASGNIQLTTRDKNVTMENITGRLRVEDKRGEVTVRLRQAPKEDISISTESGAVELALPSSSAFDMDAASRSGEIENEFDDADLKVTNDAHGNAALHGKRATKGPRVELHTTYGPIRLRKSD